MFIHQSQPRPKEWLHSKQCMAQALISAVQNLRDSDISHREFQFALQDNELMYTARGYLDEGLQDCRCNTVEYTDPSTGDKVVSLSTVQ
jgi:hypothetical protein